MKNLSNVFILLLVLSIFQSCAKEEADNGVAPTLPTAESFIMPFDGFEDADTTGYAPLPDNGDGADQRTPTFNNWFYSATNVVVWNAILTVNLAVPVAAFYGAFNHDATFEGNATWLWAYEVTGNDGATYKAKLYGEVLGVGEVQWDMYISKVGGFTDVHWYSGVTSNNGGNATATWNLNHQPNNPQSFLTIEYQKDNGNGAESIRYTNNIPNNAGNGGYIEFRKSIDGTVDYNRNYDVFKIEDNNLLEIQWNDPAKNGRVKNEVRFGDTDWHCWDTNLQDIDC